MSVCYNVHTMCVLFVEGLIEDRLVLMSYAIDKNQSYVIDKNQCYVIDKNHYYYDCGYYCYCAFYA